MTKEQALKMLKLLSALESWAHSVKAPPPEYLWFELDASVETLEKIILGEDK